MSAHPITTWPGELSSIGAIRFARRSRHFDETVKFYRDLVGLPLHERFEESYGANGAIFAMPTSAVTFEIVAAAEPVAVDPHEQLCLYFPDERAKQAAIARLSNAGLEAVQSHPYWAATGAVTYRDPDGREVVFAPFIYGTDEPPAGVIQGKHEFPSA